jgi:hypothetical protein
LWSRRLPDCLGLFLSISDFMCKALFTNMLMVAAVSISPVVKSIFEAENGDGSYRRSSEAVQVFVHLCLFLTLQGMATSITSQEKWS